MNKPTLRKSQRITQHLVENQKGIDSMKSSIIMQNKVFIRIAIATGIILLIPLVLTLLNISNGGVEGQGWYWKPGDFIVMGTLIFGMSSLFVLAARKVSKKYWAILGIAFAILLLYLWAELAVGIFTNWGS